MFPSYDLRYNKLCEFKNCDGGIIRFGNFATCHIKGKWSISLDGKTNNEDVYFVDGLKCIRFNVRQLVHKVYQL